MGLERLLKPRRTTEAGRALYQVAVAQARQSALYAAPGGLGSPDTVEGRFELYTLHVVLLLHRLKRNGPAAADTGQALFDAYVRGLDDALREIGVGDLSVGKKMRKLGEVFYGRAKSYDEALEALPDAGPLQAILERTGLAAAGDEALAGYAVRAAGRLKDTPLDELLEGRVQWPLILP